MDVDCVLPSGDEGRFSHLNCRHNLLRYTNLSLENFPRKTSLLLSPFRLYVFICIILTSAVFFYIHHYHTFIAGKVSDPSTLKATQNKRATGPEVVFV